MVEFLFKTSRGKPPQRKWGEPTDFHGKGFRISSLPNDAMIWDEWQNRGLDWLSCFTIGFSVIFLEILTPGDVLLVLCPFFPIFFSITQNVHGNFVSAPCFLKCPPCPACLSKKGHRFTTHHSSPPPLPGKVLGSWRCLQGIGAIVAPSCGGAPVDGEFRSPNPKYLTWYEVTFSKSWWYWYLTHVDFYNINCIEMFHRKEIMRYFLILRTGARWISSINSRMGVFWLIRLKDWQHFPEALDFDIRDGWWFVWWNFCWGDIPN